MKPHIRITCVLTAILFAFAALSFSACKKSRDLSGSELWRDSLSDNAEPEAKEYETGLFDTGYVHQINVEIDEADWNDLGENPLNKTKYKVSVTIDGTKVENVSFAAKSNTSLSHVASTDSNRYSFKINFGKYEKGQTYQGLDGRRFARQSRRRFPRRQSSWQSSFGQPSERKPRRSVNFEPLHDFGRGSLYIKKNVDKTFEKVHN